MVKFINMNSLKTLHVTSKAFSTGDTIPKKYTCDGLNVSPPFEISFIPNDAVCLAIIMEDPDAPISTWYHWLIWNVPVTHHIDENGAHGIQGLNDFSRRFYCGPCPMSGVHNYVFKIYALDALLNVPPNIKRKELEIEIANHVLAYGEISGFYGRESTFYNARKN